jgi:hypothetical protein
VPLSLRAWRNGSLASDQEAASAPAINENGDAALTRRRWITAAGGVGIAGAMGWLETSRAAAAAPPPATTSSDCRCSCCHWFTLFGHLIYCDIYCCFDCGGFSGGGVVQTASGTAQASFSGNKTQLKNSKQLVTGGALSWFDAGWQGTGLSLQSTQITSYGKLPGSGIRQLVGFATANGSGKHKFVLQVTDAGQPGSGQDTVSLTVKGVAGGGAGGSGSQYNASGHLTQGDITTSLQSTVSTK